MAHLKSEILDLICLCQKKIKILVGKTPILAFLDVAKRPLCGGHDMLSCELWNCTDVLLSVLCYEMHNALLSSEMKTILQDHLEECEYCRTKFLDLKHLFEHELGATTYVQ
jgi:hypothetical protein